MKLSLKNKFSMKGGNFNVKIFKIMIEYILFKELWSEIWRKVN